MGTLMEGLVLCQLVLHSRIPGHRLLFPRRDRIIRSLVCWLFVGRPFLRSDTDAPVDLIKYDTPYLGPKIQLMLSQLEFKLSVEKQYKAGIEKMVRLYQDEGDRKSRADAEGRRIESNQKIQLLKQALKRYEDLHVDIESTDAAPDGTFLYFLLRYSY